MSDESSYLWFIDKEHNSEFNLLKVLLQVICETDIYAHDHLNSTLMSLLFHQAAIKIATWIHGQEIFIVKRTKC
jgi:hypothetical protein